MVFMANSDSRLIIPGYEVKGEKLTSRGKDGEEIVVNLEYGEGEITLGQKKYHFHIGSTAGRKGEPNQDAAGLVTGKMVMAEEDWDFVLGIVADGVSSRKDSAITSLSVVEKIVTSFEREKEVTSFDDLIDEIWSIASTTVEPTGGDGATTLALFLLGVHDETTRMWALNCGDSRVYWATQEKVYTADVHTDIATGMITASLMTAKNNLTTKKDVYEIDEEITAVYLCTDTFAYMFDGVHFPKEMIPTYGRALGSLNDHLSAIVLRLK